MNIYLTDTAEKDLSKIFFYIKNEFGLSAKNKFESKLMNLYQNLINSPEMGHVISRDIRRIVLHHQTSIIYQFDKKDIYILMLWDNRRKPIW